MTIYSGILNRVIDGTTIELDLDIGNGQIQTRRIRIEGTQANNIFKNYRSGNVGASGVHAKLEVLKWFADNSSELSCDVLSIDICGRGLSIVTANGNPISLNDYLKAKIYKNHNWNEPEQDTLVDEWFDGEQVTIPGGDELPIFHIWGKPQLLGGKATQINII